MPKQNNVERLRGGATAVESPHATMHLGSFRTEYGKVGSPNPEAHRKCESLRLTMREVNEASTERAGQAISRLFARASYSSAKQPGGLPDGSRGSQRSEDPRWAAQFDPHPEGVPESSFGKESISCTPPGCVPFTFRFRGYRRALRSSTPGYLLAPLRGAMMPEPRLRIRVHSWLDIYERRQ